MKLRGITMEDFVNYKLPSLFLASCFCDFKCCDESGADSSMCQNSQLARSEIKDIDDETIYQAFADNPITKAVVIEGLEPMLQFGESKSLIETFRSHGEQCPFVIYTGYYPEEITEHLGMLRPLGNIIIKVGRYIPSRASRFDEILGVELASNNQYAIEL